ncbi:MAG: beta-lactamase family protein [Thermomicrobiales bacterium]|nr:beta-lactamase family protein [Thermomicrobiales bacterium]
MELNRERIEQLVDEGSFSGVVAVDVGSERTFELCRGFAHRAHEVPIRPDTAIAIASGNKAFTALAIMQLVEEGRLRLDQPVRDILGLDLPLIDDRVTIAHLLQHTSGIGDYIDEESDWEVDDYVLGVPMHTLTTAESLLSVLDGFPQAFAPGERFAYNNGGYAVLGIVLERLTGEPFQDLIERKVIGPAGLERTGFLRLDELPAWAALGYLYETGDRVNTLHLPVRGAPDGGAFTTAADLHAFWRALFAGRIVLAETVAQMTTPLHEDPGEDLHYGMGFYVHQTGRVVILMGYDAGASFMTWHLPELDMTISVLGNTSEGAWPIISEIASEIEAFLGV